MQRSIFAEPFIRHPDSSWINSYIELRAFERLNTINHPRYGRVVMVERLEEQQEWQRLIDQEAAAYQQMLSAPISSASTSFEEFDTNEQPVLQRSTL